VIVILAVGLMVTFVGGTASAEAGDPASCMGHEASAISPPGSSEEIPSGSPGLKAFIDETFPGVPPGAVYSTIARVRAGSHAACDEALE
jgi:hypothetical protein